MRLTTAKTAIHDAYAIHLTGSQGLNPDSVLSDPSSNKPDVNQWVCNAAEAGMVIAVVEGLDEPFKSWAKWAYAPRTQEYLPEQARFFRWLNQDVTDNLSSINRVYRESTQEKIRDVVAFCVMDYRSFILSGKHLYPVNLVIERCKIHRQNWARDFVSWHEYYWNVCDEYLDRTALRPVAKVVARLKGGKE